MNCFFATPRIPAWQNAAHVLATHKQGRPQSEHLDIRPIPTKGVTLHKVELNVASCHLLPLSDRKTGQLDTRDKQAPSAQQATLHTCVWRLHRV